MRPSERVETCLPLAGILALQALLVIGSSWWNSPCCDEVGHLAAGLHHWETGTLDLYRVNPPLARLAATWPLWLSGVRLPPVPAAERGPTARPEFELGSELIAAYKSESIDLFRAARVAQCPLVLVGTAAIYFWVRDLYGRAVAMFATLSWVFNPTSIATAQYISPDAVAASFGVAAGYQYWKWLHEVTAARAVITGLLFGLALSAKSTVLVFVPLWVALGAAQLASTHGAQSRSKVLSAAGRFALLLSSSLLVLNVAYGFEDTGAALEDLPLTSDAMTRSGEGGARVNRFAGTTVGRIPLPVPGNFIRGIDVQNRDFERGYPSYLCGEWRQGGWWYYYLYALLIKTPVPFQLVLLVAVVRVLAGRAGSSFVQPASHALLVLVVVSFFTGFSHHSRYALPSLPFACVFAASGWAYLWQRSKLAAAGLIVWTGLACLLAYPHYICYYNEYVGGSKNGYRHMIDSNTDWGQDLIRLRDWQSRHPEAACIGLAYYGRFDPAVVGVQYTLPPRLGQTERRNGLDAPSDPPRPGWYAVSVTLLQGQAWAVPDGRGRWVNVSRDDFSYFRGLAPVETIGNTIHVFYLSPSDCLDIEQKWAPGPNARP